MHDLDRAKDLLAQNQSITCAFVHKETVLTDSARGVAPLLARLSGEIKDFSAADRIVGRAAALLYVLAGVKEVYGEVMSASAEKTFHLYGIPCSCGVLVEQIINRRGDGPCPMEAATEGITDPKEGLAAIRAKLEALRATR